VQFEESSLSSSSHLPSSTVVKDCDSKDFPPTASTHRVDHEVSSSSSQSSDSKDVDSPSPSPTMPCWACHTLESTGTLVGDPFDTWRTRSQHQDILHSYIATASNSQSFIEASSIVEWDSTMEEEYNSLIQNKTWDLVPLPKGIKLVRHK
jgi:hypothetical protein